ncbi:histidine kinase [Halarcobacter mediterraneus]|uniref:histidine kinase n=1 Tax=Halarcobacter mediterraneus TaxID=2023153 RepID=A0A4Q1B0L8_9BACT|nr:histidine kinase [Halarcobacter mediterraneus]
MLFLFLFYITFLQAKDLKKVSLQLSWFDQFQFAGYYIAKEKGFFKDYGLDVEIKPFTFGISVPTEVDEKRADFGIDRETLILQKVAGKNIVALYALFQESPLVLFAKDDLNINSIEDFKDKKIMTTIDDSSEVSIKSMIQSKNIKIEELNFIKHTHNILDLIEGKVDIISGYLSKAPYTLDKMKIDYKTFDPKNYGFDMYSDFLFTNKDMIENDIQTALSFKHAALKGWEYAYSNMEESVEILLKKYNSQNLSKEELLFEAEVLKKLSYSNTEELGKIKPEKMQRIYDLYNIMGLTPKKIDLDKFVLYEKFYENINLTNTEKEYIEKSSNIKMCIIPNIKPYSFIENEKFDGYVSDYMNLISEKTSLKFDLVKTTNMAESLKFLKESKCDILASAQETKRRVDYLTFTEPFLETSLALIGRNETSFIDSIKMLKGKKLSIYESYSFNKILREKYPKLTFINVKDLDEGIKKVRDKEVFAHIDFLHTSWIKIHELNYSDLKIAGKLDEVIPLSLAINKENLFLSSVLQKAVRSIKQEDKDRLLKKWVAIEYKKEFDYDTLSKVILGFIVILAIFFYRQSLLKRVNNTLQKRVEEKTRELQIMNQELENRVKNEVEKNIKKDALLTKQSKMAAIGEMLQNIAHQWRQPLSIISTGASGLKLQKEMDGKIDSKMLDETLDKIVETSVYLSTTIDDFMHFFKPNEAKRVFFIQDTITKTLNIFDYNLHIGKIKIIKNINDVKLINYESELIQVIMNILSNSKDAFIERQIEKRYVFISTKVEKDILFLSIKDNAGGIPRDSIDKIFEPYFTTKHQFQGTGIGLFMCQEIITKHMKGEIFVSNQTFQYDNEEFDGAEFIVKLPMK